MTTLVPEKPSSKAAPVAVAMSERDVALAMIGLITSLFFAVLSNTVVLTALPRIIAELHGTQADYTWIVTSSLLTITVCTPIWGRMSDLMNKKLLIQLCVAGYVLSSMGAGLAPTAGVIILCRVGIGICAAGIIAIMQAISVDIVSARERARWVGYRGAAMAVATVGAPSLGGVITDHFGWRWCFVIGVPFAVVSIVMVQQALRLPPPQTKRSARIDWPGAMFLTAGVVALMLCASVVGPDAGWTSPLTIAVFLGGAAFIAIALWLELRSLFPLLPLELFRERDVVLCVIAGAGVGMAFFCSAVFLATYLQIGRGLSASVAGLMALPESLGTLVASLVAGHVIARRGHYRRSLIFGASLIVAGFLMLSTLGTTTRLVQVGVYVALLGAGLGIVSENLILVVQNAVARGTAGSAGALVAFFRSLGAVICVAVLGAVLSALVAAEIHAGGGSAYQSGGIPNLATLTEPMRSLVSDAYAHGVAMIYFICVPAALLILGSVSLLHERPLASDNPLLAKTAEAAETTEP